MRIRLQVLARLRKSHTRQGEALISHRLLNVSSACLWTLSVAVIITASSPLPSSAAEAIGQVVLLQGKASAQTTGGPSRNLSVQSEIYMNDQITTAENSKIQLMFADDSIISQGPDSAMVVDEFLYDPANKPRNKSSSRMMKGVFRVITGKITELNPDKFKLKTRSATIGIRGCEIAVVVGDNLQEDQILIFEVPPHGSIIVESNQRAGKRGGQIVARNPGMAVYVGQNGRMRQGNIALGDARRIMHLCTPDPRGDAGQVATQDAANTPDKTTGSANPDGLPGTDPVAGTPPGPGDPTAPPAGEPTGLPPSDGGPTLMAGAPYNGGTESFTGLEINPIIDPTPLPGTLDDTTSDIGTTVGDRSGLPTDSELTIDGVIIDGNDLGGLVTDFGIINDGEGTEYTVDGNGDLVTTDGNPPPAGEDPTVYDVTGGDTSSGDGGIVIGSLTATDPTAPPGDPTATTVLDPTAPPPSGTTDPPPPDGTTDPPPTGGTTGGTPPPPPVFNMQSSGADWDWGIWTQNGNITGIGRHGNIINGTDFQALASGATLHTLTGNGTSGALIDHMGTRRLVNGTAVLDVQFGMNFAPTWAGSFNLSNGNGDSLTFGSVGTIQASGDLTGSRTTYNMMVSGSGFNSGSIAAENISGKLVGPGIGPTPVTGAVGDFMFDHGGGTLVNGVFGSDLAPGTPQN